MKRRDIILLLVSSVILVAAWIIFSIIHQLVSSTVPDTVTQSIAPIQPQFDVPVINTLKIREKVAPVFTNQAQEITPTPTLGFTPPGSPSATPRPTFRPSPTATAGGSTQ